MEFRIVKFEDKNLLIIQHEEQTVGAVKLDEIKKFLNDKDESIKFLGDEMNK